MVGHASVTDHNIMVFANYSVADSIRFMFANMKIPAIAQIAMSTTHTLQSGILIQRRPGTETR